MASSKEYLTWVLEQLSGLEEVSYRGMMGEFLLYYRGKIIGGIYDNRLLVKPTEAARRLLPVLSYELPYEGGKEMLLVTEVDQPALLRRLFEESYPELPSPKPKGKGGWNLVRSQKDIDQLMHLSGGFHDCCIVRVEYRSGNCTDSQGAMHFGDADQHEVLLLLHSQWTPPVELCFTGVRQLHLTGWQKDYTSEITDAHLSFYDHLLPGRVILWADSDCFDPTAVPNALGEPSVSYIVANALRWRVLR